MVPERGVQGPSQEKTGDSQSYHCSYHCPHSMQRLEHATDTHMHQPLLLQIHAQQGSYTRRSERTTPRSYNNHCDLITLQTTVYVRSAIRGWSFWTRIYSLLKIIPADFGRRLTGVKETFLKSRFGVRILKTTRYDKPVIIIQHLKIDRWES